LVWFILGVAEEGVEQQRVVYPPRPSARRQPAGVPIGSVIGSCALARPSGLAHPNRGPIGSRLDLERLVASQNLQDCNLKTHHTPRDARDTLKIQCEEPMRSFRERMSTNEHIFRWRNDFSRSALNAQQPAESVHGVIRSISTGTKSENMPYSTAACCARIHRPSTTHAALGKPAGREPAGNRSEAIGYPNLRFSAEVLPRFSFSS
jgi:hypothetical protein